MANNANTVTLVGNLTRDPELRFTSGGAPLAQMGMAVNRSWRNKQSNEWEEETSFFNLVAWRDIAENAAESLKKGDRVIITGRLEQRSWENDQGEKRSVVEVVVDEIGPSLRWATAEVSKVDRRPGDASKPSGGGGSTPPPSEPGPSYDEEPF